MIEIISPDDFHQHLRDGPEVLSDILTHVTKQFKRAIVMPNLQPPIRTLQDAQPYHDRIIDSLPVNSNFTPLMTLYLTDSTT